MEQKEINYGALSILCIFGNVQDLCQIFEVNESDVERIIKYILDNVDGLSDNDIVFIPAYKCKALGYGFALSDEQKDKVEAVKKALREAKEAGVMFVVDSEYNEVYCHNIKNEDYEIFIGNESCGNVGDNDIDINEYLCRVEDLYIDCITDKHDRLYAHKIDKK